MTLKNTKLVQLWNETADKLGGNFSMPFQRVNGGVRAGGVFLFNIEINYHNILISIHSGIDEIPLKHDEYESCEITITAKKESKENVELSIWRKDFMDRIFNVNKSRTGHRNFDKIIGLRASKNIGRYLPQIFRSKDLRDDLINDKYRMYNIQTIEKMITIQRKSALNMKNSDMIISDYKKFCSLLDGLIDAKIL